MQPDPEYLHDEWCISTRALLVLCVFASQASRRRLDKARGSRLLTSILAKLVTGSVAQKAVEFPSAALLLCGARAGGRQACEHLSPLMMGMSSVGSVSPQKVLSDTMHSLFQMQCACVSARSVLQGMLSFLGLRLPDQVPTAAFTSDPTQARLLDSDVPEGKRRRRLGGDFKEFVATRVVQDGRAGSSHAFLRCDGQVTASASSPWEEKTVWEYQSAAWLTFSGSGSISIAIDGSRVGQPAREMEVCFAWENDKGVGAWCPPQAFMGPVVFQSPESAGGAVHALCGTLDFSVHSAKCSRVRAGCLELFTPGFMAMPCLVAGDRQWCPGQSGSGGCPAIFFGIGEGFPVSFFFARTIVALFEQIA